MNDRAALELLTLHGPLTRTRVSELTGLSKPTTSQLLTRLEAAGLVLSGGSLSGGPGPSPRLYEIDPHSAHVAALAVDPAGITAAVADISGRVTGTHRVEAPAAAAPPTVGTVEQAAAQLVAAAIDGALATAGLERADLHRTVIGTPGAIDPVTGTLLYAPHLPGWHSRTLRDELAELIGTPIVIENDVDLAAVAEQQRGAAQDSDDFVLIWADSGVGAAIVLGGTLLRGATGGAGEIGYLPLPGAPLTRAGEDTGGGFQRLVASPSVLRLAAEYGVPGGTAAEALAAARASPGPGDALLAELARRLATGIAAVVAVVNPELVVLSGEVPRAGGEQLRSLVEAELTGLPLPRPQLRLSSLEDRPVLSGALRTALADARESVFDTSRAGGPGPLSPRTTSGRSAHSGNPLEGSTVTGVKG
ncbi:MAG TPA: sugar kinase [Streptomyces sp.]|nr:sugar kinase [Streptomyces sp.]